MSEATTATATDAGTQPEAGMTVDELARAGDVVVSTVRLYQNRGLLAPPEKRGRVGYYERSHLDRLRLITQLQERGFSLAGIKQLLDGIDRGESLRAVLGLTDVPSTWAPEPARRMPVAELAGHLPGVDFTPELVDRIAALGLVDLPTGEGDPGEVEVRSPTFVQVGSALAALGVPSEVILDEYERLRADADRIAERFTAVFRRHLWDPAAEAGMPAGRVTELVDAIEDLGPLAETVVVMALRHALQDRADAFVAAEAERLDLPIPRPGTRP